MKPCPKPIATLFVICATALLVGQHAQRAQAEDGWITLFDGKNLDNWNQIGNANWKL